MSMSPRMIAADAAGPKPETPGRGPDRPDTGFSELLDARLRASPSARSGPDARSAPDASSGPDASSAPHAWSAPDASSAPEASAARDSAPPSKSPPEAPDAPEGDGPDGLSEEGPRAASSAEENGEAEPVSSHRDLSVEVEDPKLAPEEAAVAASDAAEGVSMNLTALAPSQASGGEGEDAAPEAPALAGASAVEVAADEEAASPQGEPESGEVEPDVAADAEGAPAAKATETEGGAEVDAPAVRLDEARPPPVTDILRARNAADGLARDARLPGEPVPRASSFDSGMVERLQDSQQIQQLKDGRLRLQLVDDGERVTLMVTEREGSVRLSARMSSQALATAMTERMDELRGALAQHGIGLDELDARADSQGSDRDAPDDPDYEDDPAEGASSRVVRTGPLLRRQIVV